MKLKYTTMMKTILLNLIGITFLITGCSAPLISREMVNPSNNHTQLYSVVSTPTNVNASNSQIDVITITFDPVQEALSYNIYKSNKADGIYGIVATGVTQTTYQDSSNNSSFLSGSYYYYKVTAVNKDNVESNFSNIAKGMCYTSSCNLHPPVITYISNCEASNYIKISWEPVKVAFGYKLERNTDPSNSEGWQVIATTIPKDTTIYEDKDNFNSDVSTYYYRMSSLNDQETSIYSDIVIGSLCDSSMIAPRNLTATYEESNTNITLNFISQYEQFEIYRSSEEKGPYHIIGKGNATNTQQEIKFEDTLQDIEVKEKPYFYRVQAIAGNKRSAMSEIACGSLKVEAPKITFKGGDIAYIDLQKGEFYDEELFRPLCIDNVDGDISKSVYVIKGGVDSEKTGTYQVTYQVSDKSGNSSSATRTFKVGRSPSLKDATITFSTSSIVVYQPFTITVDNVSPKSSEIDSSVGEVITYSATHAKSFAPITNGGKFNLTLTDSTKKHTIQIIAKNDFGSDSKDLQIDVEPFVTPLTWSFENGFGPYCADGAIDIANPGELNFPKFTGVKENYSYAGGAYASEKIIEVVNNYFSMCDTTASTSFWGAGDKQGTSIRLRNENTYTLEANKRYKLNLDIYRGEGAKADVVISLGGKSVTAPKSSGWHNIELFVTPTSNIATFLEVNKGGWNENIRAKDVANYSDQIEVRVANILLICDK